MTEVVPLAYKFRAKKDGIINEFIALKDISLEEAQNKSQLPPRERGLASQNAT